MTGYEQLVREEIDATIDRAGFERPPPEAIRVDVTDSFRRKLGECRVLPTSEDTTGTSTTEPRYEIRIARRLFDSGSDDQWRDTVRHELAHAYVLETIGPEAQPHGEAWRDAARRAGADPVARCEGDDTVDAEYVLACPNGCTAWPYQRRTKRIKTPWLYACPECDATLLSCDIDDRPIDLEPGCCHVTSLPWRDP